jgi:hypothetical protein
MFDGSEGVNWVAQRADAASLDMYFLGYGHNYKIITVNNEKILIKHNNNNKIITDYKLDKIWDCGSFKFEMVL